MSCPKVFNGVGNYSTEKRVSNSKNEYFLFQTDYPFSHQVDVAVSKGVTKFVIHLKSLNKQFCKKDEFVLKNEIVKHLDCGRKDISSLCMDGNGNFNLKVSDEVVAKKAFKIRTLKNQPVRVELQQESLSSKFLVEGICADVPLEDLVWDLESQNVHPLKVERFRKNVDNIEVSSDSVLITQIGKSVPEEVKLFYEVFTTHLLSEKTLQERKESTNWKLERIARSCNEKLCGFCAIHHSKKNTYLNRDSTSTHSGDSIGTSLEEDTMKSKSIFKKQTPDKSIISFPSENEAMENTNKEFEPEVDKSIQIIEQIISKTEERIEKVFETKLEQYLKKIDDFFTIRINILNEKLVNGFEQKIRSNILNLTSDLKNDQFNQNSINEECKQNTEVSQSNIPTVKDHALESTDTFHSSDEEQNKDDNGLTQEDRDEDDINSSVDNTSPHNQDKSIEEEDDDESDQSNDSVDDDVNSSQGNQDESMEEKDDDESDQSNDSVDDDDDVNASQGNQDESMKEKDKDPSETTLRYIVLNCSKLHGTSVSPATLLRNLPWKIKVMLRTKKGAKLSKPVRSLGLYLECNGDEELNDESKEEPQTSFIMAKSSTGQGAIIIDRNWSCNTRAELRMLSQKEGVNDVCMKIDHVFCEQEYDWGFSHIIDFDVALDPERGYIKDDAITFEVFIMADAPNGVRKPSLTAGE